MRTEAKPRKPELDSFGYPIWWHQHGSDMSVKGLNRQKGILVINGRSAKVTIMRASSLHRGMEGWFVDWEIGFANHGIVHGLPSMECVRGRIRFSDAHIKTAFGFEKTQDIHSRWLLEQYGADVAFHGKYIRWGRFLNIPCPGTGYDGDPNVSIEVSVNIHESIRQLLGLR
jgi:hypothetical protein